MKLASEQPSDEDGVTFEATILAEVAERDAETALNMLHYAKDRETIESAYESIGTALIEEGKAERAVDLVRNEPEELQTRFYRQIWLTWVRSDAQGMYNHLDKLPTSELQDLYSRALLKVHEKEAFLELEQIEELKSFISE